MTTGTEEHVGGIIGAACCSVLCQLPRFIFDPLGWLTALEKAEINPGKDSDTRIKPLALTNGHGRYMTVTPERTLASVGECPLNI
jgi:hypothetical protein